MLAEHPERLVPFCRFFEALDEPLAIIDRLGAVVSANRSLLGRLSDGLDLSTAAVLGNDLAGLVALPHRVLLTAFVDWYFRNRSDSGDNRPVEFAMTLGTLARNDGGKDLGPRDRTSIEVVLRWSMLPDVEAAAVAFRFEPVVARSDARTHPEFIDLAAAQRPERPSSGKVGGEVAVELADKGVGDGSMSGPGESSAHGSANGSGDSRTSSARIGRAALSLREREIVQLVLDGNRVSTIASRLFLSENTVRNHLKRVYRKLGVSSLGELRESVGSNQRAS